ncbi:metallophosphoesterase [Clostridium oryzae]|uniref:Putative metallophosphoesterase n=1 Tax=Clostridium oryzae TaxID=1450648 RepID=A0A1V4IBT2_9CLOT|nr:metallophosphoesterase [Clostridium oryzae]OPJ57314.1 putative metallophosphoesterase [Clostridium oryzae]
MKILFVLLIIGIVALIWSIFEAQVFGITKIRLTNKKYNGKMKIVFISDIHYGKFYAPKRLEKIIESINYINPDIILIGGDYFDIKRNSKLNKKYMHELINQISKLNKRNRTFTVIGNHDYYICEDKEQFFNSIIANDIVVLKNNSVEVEVNGQSIAIHGLDDLFEGQVDVDKLQLNPELMNIVISHNPDVYQQFNKGFDIGFAGHNHGGQITLFGLYAPVTESEYGQKFIKQVNNLGNTVIITTKGLGTSSMPLRFFAYPEIMEIDINQ